MRCGGWAFPLKWQRGALADFTGTVSTAEPRVVLEPFGGAGRRGILEHGAVRIEDPSGQVVARRDDPRPKFRRLRRNFWWDDLDLLYFAAYALWGYINAPSCSRTPTMRSAEIDPWVERRETWRGLEVTFPDDVPGPLEESSATTSTSAAC